MVFLAFYSIAYSLRLNYAKAEDCSPESLNVLSDSNVQNISVFENKAFKAMKTKKETIELLLSHRKN